MKYGIIDIGSTSVRFGLIEDGKTIYKKLRTTKLGTGLTRTGNLQEDTQKDSIEALSAFVALSEAEAVDHLYAFATAAVRGAKNGADFVKKVYDACGLQIEVISGEAEAWIGLFGALQGKDGAIIDIGGASTEISVCKSGRSVYSKSVPLGAVKLFDMAGNGNSEESRNALLRIITEYIADYGAVPIEGLPVYAIGGTATTLAAGYLRLAEYDPKKVDGLAISRREVCAFTEILLKKTPKERMREYRIPDTRADIIGGGCLLLCNILQKYGIPRIIISESDNIEGFYLLKTGGLR